MEERIMTRLMLLLCAGLCGLTFVVPATTAQATTMRTWVSSSGSDTTPGTCTQAAPCLSFAHAVSQTSTGGEIDCLSGGDYGPVTITGSITIDCGEGNVGLLEPNGSTATIIINVSSAATVILRHLSLNGFGANAIGIYTIDFPSGTVVVEHCQIVGFSGGMNGAGIYFTPSSGRGTLEVSDTVVDDNYVGIFAVANASTVTASVVLDGVKLNDNSFGLALEGTGVIAGTLRHSVAAENSVDGITATASQVYFTVEESSIVDNLSYGITSPMSPGVMMEVGASTIGGNGTGVSAAAGSVYTFGNNQFSANGSNGSFTPGGPGLQ
jgi:hypothetical protein